MQIEIDPVRREGRHACLQGLPLPDAQRGVAVEMHERGVALLETGQMGQYGYVVRPEGHPGAQGLERPAAGEIGLIVAEEGEVGVLARQGLAHEGGVVEPAGTQAGEAV